MAEISVRPDAPLAGSTIAILMESDYVEQELHYYERRFAEEGARVAFLTRLWGQDEMTFHGHEFQLPFTVNGDLEAVDLETLRTFDALIVPSGMVSDRLRYAEKAGDVSPAVRLLQQAFAEPSVLKGIICHGMWLVAPIPEVVRGRRVTCHNNLHSDIVNMGANYTDQDVVVDGDLVTARSADKCHLFARMIIDMVEARRARPAGASPAQAQAQAQAPTAQPQAQAPTAQPQAQAQPQPEPTVRAPTEGQAPTEAGSEPGSAGGPRPLQQASADEAPDSWPVSPGSAQPVEPGAQADPEPAATAGYRPDFTFSDLIAGYVVGFDTEHQTFDVRTSHGRTIRAILTTTTYAELTRNLSAPYVDATGHLADLLTPGRYLFAYGVFYPRGDEYVLEAKRLLFVGRGPGEYEFEKPGWWIDQIREIANFYRKAQFGPGGPVDYTKYRTFLRLGGDKTDDYRQETDTISRLIYGMSSAHMLTGDERFLEVAERGTEYLRAHMRFVDRDEQIVYWYHGIDVRNGVERKLFTSEFGDDYDAIPMYEQIYALCGPTQLYRVTGDRRIASDTEATMRLFESHFRDKKNGGYFSHIDPLLLRPDHESLGPNQSRKNWNSIGDHAPAYLINLWLATGDQRYAAMLEETEDLILQRMPDPGSPFVQERFHADWSPDSAWSWQQDRAVVGHNLKIAWNMMRMMSIRPKDEYRELAKRIGQVMPELGSDQQRGGWYDVVERHRSPGDQRHRFVWHDRKAWWQQEQAILAYLILTGLTGDEEFRRQAREAASFYNAFFLDHDEGGVYFNVTADGTPWLVGNERLKGNHSMSMYHSAELCYLSTVYEHLLLNNQPLTLWFKPQPGGFPDGILRVSPDALPAGRVRLDQVEIDGQPYPAFDAEAMTVKLPESDRPVTVKVTLVPAGGRRDDGR
jgi:mannose/cellobiose epimerase-like protein (N-acyl-D-glucosamine 2-epimerase family)/putative intracellular protease/amidase